MSLIKTAFQCFCRERPVDRTQLVKLKSHSQSGPILPKAMGSHCLVKLNESIAITTGGYNGKDKNNDNDRINLDSTFFFDIDNMVWTSGPKLLDTRKRHACGVIRFQEATVIVVAGGLINTGGVKDGESTEVLVVETNHESHDLVWRKGPVMPHVLIEGAVMVSSSTGNWTTVIGGVNNNGIFSRKLMRFECVDPTMIYLSYDPEELCKWTVLQQKLEFPR